MLNKVEGGSNKILIDGFIDWQAGWLTDGRKELFDWDWNNIANYVCKGYHEVFQALWSLDSPREGGATLIKYQYQLLSYEVLDLVLLM